jgi:integrase
LIGYDCKTLTASEQVMPLGCAIEQSLFRVKTFMSAIFSEAIRAGLRKDDQNPVVEVKVRGLSGQQKKKTVTFAYSLDDIRRILGVLSEPSRVLIAVAAFTALRRSEIVALKWDDYDGKAIWVRRNICFGEKGEMSVELTKTEASEAPVPVIAPLRRILDAWKAKAEVTDGCWIFQAGFTRKNHPADLLDAAKMTPLSPANILRDSILSALEKAKIEWHGYHAFRRGLATNLHALGVDDLTVSEILRHSDVAVTRASYIKRVGEKATAAMEKFEQELAKAWDAPAYVN